MGGIGVIGQGADHAEGDHPAAGRAGLPLKKQQIKVLVAALARARA